MQKQQRASAVRPPIVRALADDWRAAAKIVFADTFSAAATIIGVLANTASIEFAAWLADWRSRRDACAPMGLRCTESGKPELACAWALLAVDPTCKNGPKIEAQRSFLLPFFAMADAVSADPALLNDSKFTGRLLGLRYVAEFSIGAVEDPILAAQAFGAGISPYRDEMLLWARRLSSRQED